MSEINKPPHVAWSWGCLPTMNGGLGIRDCIAWNAAAVGKFVRQVAQKEDVLWIKQVHNIYIRESSLWDYKALGFASWI